MAKTALVLAGGGALGSYEIGAYEVLKEMGYSFDIITGTSIGALNGAYLAAGQDKEAKDLWLNVTPELVMKDGINISKKALKDYAHNNHSYIVRAAKSYLKHGFSMDNTPFKEYVSSTLDVKAVLKSKIQLGIVTCHTPTLIGEEILVNKLEERLVKPFLHASSACVPIFPVEQIDGKKYVDGVFYDNLPIKFAFELGASNVVAIDLRLFSMKPQNSFFLSLPNVIHIAPYKSLGSLMDFSQETIRRNMERGRLDTYKYFGKLRGYSFAFKLENKNANMFVARIAEKYGKKSNAIYKALSKDIRTPMDGMDFFYNTIELLLENALYDNYTKIHTIEDVRKVLHDAIHDENGKLVDKKFDEIAGKDRESVVKQYFRNFLTRFAVNNEDLLK